MGFNSGFKGLTRKAECCKLLSEAFLLIFSTATMSRNWHKASHLVCHRELFVHTGHWLLSVAGPVPTIGHALLQVTG